MIARHINTANTLSGIIQPIRYLNATYPKTTFYHITKPQETAEQQRFFGTGAFFGPGSLSAQILQPGNNYLGHIVTNHQKSEQDMVIATSEKFEISLNSALCYTSPPEKDDDEAA